MNLNTSPAQQSDIQPEAGATTTVTRPTFGAQFMTSFPTSDGLSVGSTRSNWTTNEDKNG